MLPLRAVPGADPAVAWMSSPWPLRRERLYAVSGDSPLGLRLPLGSLPDVLPADQETEFSVDPFAPRGPLPARDKLRVGAARVRAGSAREVVKTALTLQVRDGHLTVFMPPCERLEAYVALLAAVEDTAQHLKTPVVVEGYTPPRDPRVKVLMVTPDPGVIEVNIHPASHVARSRSRRPRRSTRRRGSRAWAPRSSCSTAATPARAAATT